MKRCPCCGYLTIDDSFEVITDICEVCFWQYDEVSQDHPDISIGPNNVSLITAKKIINIWSCRKTFYKLCTVSI